MKSISVSVKLDEETKKSLEQYARDTHRTQASVIRKAVNDLLEEKNNE